LTPGVRKIRWPIEAQRYRTAGRRSLCALPGTMSPAHPRPGADRGQRAGRDSARRPRCGAARVALAACFAGAGHAGAAPADEAASIRDLLQVGGEVEIAYQRQRDFDLDRGEPDDLDLLPVEAKLEVLFAPNDYVEAFLQTTLFHAFTLRDQGEDDVDATDLFVEEAYLTFRAPDSGLALQVGRQSFEDPRQWLYDAELDAVRARYRAQRLSLELAASREALLDNDLLDPDETESANNYILYAAYELSRDVSLGAYGIVRDGAESDRPIFLGLQSAGTIAGRLSYWLDGAHVRGREDGSDLRGYGIDLLGAYHFEASLSPHLILGYAFGSGDSDPDDDRDGAFRQTGLQGNETEVGGLTPFRYYGEAFDPELSNLSIFTAGFGARPTAELSADLVYHYYLQDHAADELRDSALDAEPTGRSKRLGSEIDLVLGFEEEGEFRIRGFLGYFMPGRAFADGADPALFARIEAQYEF
jgi:alginate production protein